MKPNKKKEATQVAPVQIVPTIVQPATTQPTIQDVPVVQVQAVEESQTPSVIKVQLDTMKPAEKPVDAPRSMRKQTRQVQQTVAMEIGGAARMERIAARRAAIFATVNR